MLKTEDLKNKKKKRHTTPNLGVEAGAVLGPGEKLTLDGEGGQSLHSAERKEERTEKNRRGCVDLEMGM